MKTAPPELKSQLANLNHAQKTYQAQQLLFETDQGLLAFRDAVQLVLLLDCNQDRPLPKVDEKTGVIDCSDLTFPDPSVSDPFAGSRSS